MTRHDPRRATLGREYRRRQLHVRLRQIDKQRPIKTVLSRQPRIVITTDLRPFERRIELLAYRTGEMRRVLERCERAAS